MISKVFPLIMKSLFGSLSVLCSSCFLTVICEFTSSGTKWCWVEVSELAYVVFTLELASFGGKCTCWVIILPLRPIRCTGWVIVRPLRPIWLEIWRCGSLPQVCPLGSGLGELAKFDVSVRLVVLRGDLLNFDDLSILMVCPRRSILISLTRRVLLRQDAPLHVWHVLKIRYTF